MATKKPKNKEMVATFPDASERDKAVAKLALHPCSNAAAVIEKYATPFGAQDIGALVDGLAVTVKQVNNGDLGRAEAMLMTQAEALQSIFMNFSRRTLVQEYQKNLESFFRMAMKAQNQCRMTLETLATIKNPPIVYAKQANIAHGPQQVNNGQDFATSTRAGAHAGNSEIQTNELLEAQPYEPMDTRAPSTTSGTDSAMATMGTIDRAADNER